MLLQERIEELGSGILNLSDSNVKVIGFTCPERLYEYYNDNVQCFLSTGIYALEPLDFSRIQTNALFILTDKDGNILSKHHLELVKKEAVKYKDELKKQHTKIYYIRKCKYTDKYNYKDLDISITFDTKDDLVNYFKSRFKTELEF